MGGLPRHYLWARRLRRTGEQVDQGQTETSLGTKVTCLVTQGKPSNGSAKITVALVATKALGFAQSIAELTGNGTHDPDFAGTRTIFGAKAQDVGKWRRWLLGPATLDVSFRITKAWRPWPRTPCRTSWTFSSITRVATNQSTFASDPSRTERAQETLRISQAGSTGKTIPCGGLIFSKEVVEITP